MPFPILALPVILEIVKQLKTWPKSGVKEVSGVGVIAALSFIVQDVEACAPFALESLSCVHVDHWSMLIVSSLALVARLNGKRKDAA